MNRPYSPPKSTPIWPKTKARKLDNATRPPAPDQPPATEPNPVSEFGRTKLRIFTATSHVRVQLRNT